MALKVPRVGRGLAIGDLFNDGVQEVVVENLEGEPTILRPKGGPRNHWISFELAGTRSNKLALNARVKVIAGDLAQTDEVRSGGSYLSQSDLRLHFGLGDHRQPDKVEIFWPSGGTETLTNLEADRFYCVKEGAGVVPCASIRPAAAQHKIEKRARTPVLIAQVRINDLLMPFCDLSHRSFGRARNHRLTADGLQVSWIGRTRIVNLMKPVSFQASERRHSTGATESLTNRQRKPCYRSWKRRRKGGGTGP